MTAYQAGLAKFEEQGAQVIGISTDNAPAQGYWAKEVLKVAFPIGSDSMRQVSAAYGVLNAASGYANRATFVVDIDGVIQYIEEGNTAINPDGAAAACSRTKKKPAQ
jgi:peroxiredoxin (alkyl hydroperoxide reductase subunit C)